MDIESDKSETYMIFATTTGVKTITLHVTKKTTIREVKEMMTEKEGKSYA